MKTKEIFLCVLAVVFCTAVYVSGAVTPEMIRKAEQLKQTALEHINEGRYNKAIPLLKDVLSINPGDKTASRYLLIARQLVAEPFCKQAAEAFFEKNYSKAINQWEDMLKINPDDRRVIELIENTKNFVHDNTVDSMYALANVFYKEGKYSLAINELEKILLLNSDDKRAQEMLKTVTRTVIDNEVKGHYEKADAYMKQKRHDLAIEEWKEVLKLDKEQEAAARLIATTIKTTFLDSAYTKAEKLYEEGDYILSLGQYNRILVENPTDQYVKNIISRLNNVIRITPRIENQGMFWDVLKKSLLNHISMDGNPMVSVAAAWYAAQLEPNNKLALSIRDFIEREHTNIVRGMEHPVRDMNLVDQYLFAALNNIYSGRYDLAVQECSIVLELQPGNVLALKRLGSAYFAMKKKEKAREVWERALRLDPEDNELKKFLKEAR